MNTNIAPYQQSRGFTLIELLMYVTIVGGLLISTSVFFALTAEARVKNQTISEVNQQGTAVIEHITRIIRNANGITSPAAGATATSLTVTVPTAGLSPTIFNASGGATGTLQIKEGAGATTALTNSKVQVSALAFKNVSRPGTPGTIQVSFSLSRVNPSNRNEFEYEKTFTSSATLREP